MADATGGSVWDGSLLNLLSLLIISDCWSLEPRAAIGGPEKRSGRRLSFSPSSSLLSFKGGGYCKG